MNRNYSDKIYAITKFALENNTTPLRFEEYKSPVKIFDRKDVDKMVLRVLELTKSHASANTLTRRIETEAGKRRSALDIWRHIIYYYPDVSIFSVMRSLYKLVSEFKVSHTYCAELGRRAFSKAYIPYFVEVGMEDEFGLQLKEWKDI